MINNKIKIHKKIKYYLTNEKMATWLRPTVNPY